MLKDGRTTPGEITALQYLFYTDYILDPENGHYKAMAERVERVGKTRLWKSLSTQYHNLFQQLFNTLPPDTARKFANLTADRSLYILPRNGVGNGRGTTTVMTADLDAILHAFQLDVCNLCNGEACDMAKCHFRKAAKSLLMVELGPLEEQKGYCIYKTFNLEDKE